MKLMDIFGNKKADKNEPFTAQDRALIKKHFPTGSNVDLKSGDKPLFDANAHAVHGRGQLSFYKRDGKLRVYVGHYRDDGGPGDPKARPVTHTDHEVTDSSLAQLKKDLA